MKPKGVLFSILLVIIVTACDSPKGINTSDKSVTSAAGELAEISFSEYEYDFGKITEGEKVAHIFTFDNKGPGDLVIASASTSCGCTVTKYNRNPIPAGKGGSLEVVFDSSGRNGIQTKTVSVQSNSKTQVVILKITAEVISEPGN
jgi:hypothetical protein